MKIIQTKIPKNYPPMNGLDAIDMDRMGQLVLLAGRNGSGKSRLLEKVANAFRNLPTPKQLLTAKTNLKQPETVVNELKRQLKLWEDLKFNPTIQGDQRTQQVEQLKRNKDNHEAVIKNEQAILDKAVLLIGDETENHQIVQFVPKKLDLLDPKAINDVDREQRARNAHTLGIDNLNQYALPKIQELHTQYWHATHQHSQLAAKEKEAICNEYDRLQTNIEDLLGVRPGNDSRGTATLFGFPIGQAQLSDGQKVLLQLAVAIHCQAGQLTETIMLLDEPENHIHPGAIIEVLETLLKKISKGQIWIATHSVSVLAHFAEQGSLWYMDEGRVSPAGKIQEKVLEGLLGDSTRLSRQREFLEKPESAALTRYAQQCLCPPSAIMTGQGDPQVTQIRQVIDTLYQKHGQLKLLDYGAGKGRLIVNIKEDNHVDDDIAAKLSYVAYDMSSEYEQECKAHICKVYKTADERWFNKYDDLVAHHNKKSFHLIVLSNVLHEISPKDWESLFGPSGELTELLTDDGHILIVEDQRVPVGENAHKYGFIVLDTGALKDLFGVEGNDASIIEDSQRKGRLKAHLIPKPHLGKVNSTSIRKAMESHKAHAKREIVSMRKIELPSDGRVFAFWLVQYANVMMALEEYRE